MLGFIVFGLFEFRPRLTPPVLTKDYFKEVVYKDFIVGTWPSLVVFNGLYLEKVIVFSNFKSGWSEAPFNGVIELDFLSFW